MVYERMNLIYICMLVIPAAVLAHSTPECQGDVLQELKGHELLETVADCIVKSTLTDIKKHHGCWLCSGFKPSEDDCIFSEIATFNNSHEIFQRIRDCIVRRIDLREAQVGTVKVVMYTIAENAANIIDNYYHNYDNECQTIQIESFVIKELLRPKNHTQLICYFREIIKHTKRKAELLGDNEDDNSEEVVQVNEEGKVELNSINMKLQSIVNILSDIKSDIEERFNNEDADTGFS